MRRFLKFSALSLALAAAYACTPEKVITTEDIPTAGVRFINAVPDTFGVDMRPVDIVENSTFYGVTFRSTTLLFYKNARAGSRHFRIFYSPPVQSPPLTAEQQIQIASTVIKDTTVTLEAGHRYSFILWGFSRAGSSPQVSLAVIDDNPADPGTQVALRMLNTGGGLGALDGRYYPSTGSAPAGATWPGVAEYSGSPYVTAAAGPIKYNIRAAGGSTALFTDPTALAGVAATVDLDAQPGTTVAGSAVTGIVWPRSVAGSRATNFTTPGITFVWDRRPPRPAGL